MEGFQRIHFVAHLITAMVIGVSFSEDIFECVDSSICQNGATCYNQTENVACQCVVGYTGSFCEASTIILEADGSAVQEYTLRPVTCIAQHVDQDDGLIFFVTFNDNRLSDRIIPTYSDTNLASALLNLNVTRKMNMGQIYCEAVFTHEGVSVMSSNYLQIPVYFSATKISGSAPPGIAHVNTIYAITCITDEANPTSNIVWSWSHHGTVVPNDRPIPDEELQGECCGPAKKRNSTRSILLQREYNNVRVTCRVPNSNGPMYSTVLHVKFPPTAISMNCVGSCNVVENKTITLNCATDSFNPRQSLIGIKWKIGNSVNDDSHMIYVNHTLQIKQNATYGGFNATSTYTFQANRRLLGAYATCLPVWENGDLDNVLDHKLIDVYFPPRVNASGCSVVNEGRNCQINCTSTDGNPSDTESLTYSWQWKPNFESDFGTEISSESSLQIDTSSYRNAGTYKCTVSNLGGSNSKEEVVSIRYPPIVTDENKMEYYKEEGSNVTLNLTVHSFPTHNIAFEWTKEFIPIGPAQINHLSNNKTSSTLQLVNIDDNNYVTYSVKVTNGGMRETVFLIDLLQGGDPTAPYDLQVRSRSYDRIKISFRPGFNGGTTQTLTVQARRYDAQHENAYQQYGDDIVNPTEDQMTSREIYGNDITEDQFHEIRVTAYNTSPGQAISSVVLFVKTREKITLAEKDISIIEKDDSLILHWDEVTGEYTTIQILQCNGDTCVNHTLTDTSVKAIVLETTAGRNISFQIYQDEYLIETVNLYDDVGSDTPEPSSYTSEIVAGVISVFLLMAICATVILILLKRRKIRRHCGGVCGSDDYDNSCRTLRETVIAESDCRDRNNGAVSDAPPSVASYGEFDVPSEFSSSQEVYGMVQRSRVRPNVDPPEIPPEVPPRGRQANVNRSEPYPLPQELAIQSRRSVSSVSSLPSYPSSDEEVEEYVNASEEVQATSMRRTTPEARRILPPPAPIPPPLPNYLSPPSRIPPPIEDPYDAEVVPALPPRSAFTDAQQPQTMPGPSVDEEIYDIYDDGATLREERVHALETQEDLRLEGTSSEREVGRGLETIKEELHDAFTALKDSLTQFSPRINFNRGTLLEDVLRYYEHTAVLEKDLTVIFEGERGVDLGGLKRDLFTFAWQGILNKYFKGEATRVPFTPTHQMSQIGDKYIRIGRILTHTAALLEYVPSLISRTTLVQLIFHTSPPDDILLEDFKLYLTSSERECVVAALEDFDRLKESQLEQLQTMFSFWELHAVPNKENIRGLLVSAAKRELIQLPELFVNDIRQGIPGSHLELFWSKLDLDHINVLYKLQRPNGQSVVDCITLDEQAVTLPPEQTQVLYFFKQYVLQLDQDTLEKLLHFITGNPIQPDEIEIVFNRTAGLERRPIAHTCGNVIELSVMYNTFQEFREEFNTLLSHNSAFTMSAM